MKFLVHLVTESEVGQHVQEIACLERKEHRLEEVGLALREARRLFPSRSKNGTNAKRPTNNTRRLSTT
jgi:hypothetical protein